MGHSIVSCGHVGHLLLLYLERGQVNWKGGRSLKWSCALSGHWTVTVSLGGVFHCYLALCDVACSFDPWPYSSWGYGRSVVLSSAWCLATRWPSGRLSIRFLNGVSLRWTHFDLSVQVWMEAAAQIFFSYSVGVGSLTVLNSYNNYNYNCYKQVFLIKFKWNNSSTVQESRGIQL